MEDARAIRPSQDEFKPLAGHHGAARVRVERPLEGGERRVVPLRMVEERDQPARPGPAAEPQPLLPGGVAPPGRMVVVGMVAVVDHHVGAPDQGEEGLPRRVAGVADIGERLPAILDAEARRPLRVV